MGTSARDGVSHIFVAIVAASLIVMALGFLVGVIYQRNTVALPNITGEVHLGLDYFRGTIKLKNGGPPCGRYCHQISDIGIPGGSVGPDLSDILVTAFNGNSTRATQFLRKPTTPTMWATWQRTPLTEGEISSLVELLKYAAAHEDDL